MVTTASEELLSPEQAGDRLGVSVYTVRRWIKEGKLRAFKPGKEYRIAEADLEEFLRTREVRPKAPRRSPYEPSFWNGVEEERRAEWDAAVRNARQFREHGRTRMEELLSSWRGKQDQRALRGMERLLQEAYDAQRALTNYLEKESTGGIRLDLVPATEWEEVGEANRFYGALVEMVRGAGLDVRTEGSTEERTHEVKEAA